MGDTQALQARLAFQREQFYREVGARVRAVRESKGLTQETLASSVGLSRTSLTNIERGRQKVLLHTLAEIASALSVKTSDLFPSAVSDFDLLEIKLPSTLPPTHRDFVQRTLSPIIPNEKASIKQNPITSPRTPPTTRNHNGSDKR